jgi:hypothetical protein
MPAGKCRRNLDRIDKRNFKPDPPPPKHSYRTTNKLFGTMKKRLSWIRFTISWTHFALWPKHYCSEKFICDFNIQEMLQINLKYIYSANKFWVTNEKMPRKETYQLILICIDNKFISFCKKINCFAISEILLS